MLSKELKVRSKSIVSRAPSSSGSGSIKSSDRHAIKDFAKDYTAITSTKDPGLTIRDWMIIIAELFVSLAWVCIRHRSQSKEELAKKGITEREEGINYLFWEGWVAIFSLFVGYFIDSHISYYSVALISVIYHFSMTSFIFMEETVMLYVRDNRYSDIIAVLVTFSIIVAKSTDFTRVVFGLHNLTTKQPSKVVLFLFMFMWVGDRISEGGILWTFLTTLNLSTLAESSISFIMCGVSFYLYVFILKPKPMDPRHARGLSFKIVGCLSSAVSRKFRYRNLDNKTTWLDYADRRFDRHTILVTKELLSLFQKLCPTIGYALYVTSISEGFMKDILLQLKPTGIFFYIGLYKGMRIAMLLTMLLTQFAFIPFLTFMGVSNKFHIRFLIGYVAALLSMFYTAVALATWDSDTKLSFSVGHVRIFNVRDTAVHFTSREDDFTKLNFTVASKNSTSLQFHTGEAKLFKVAVEFDSETSWTTHLLVNPLIATGYVLTDPPHLMRIAEIPVEEGPPGTNDPQSTRLYLFNSVRNSELPFVIKKQVTKDEVYRITSRVGLSDVFQLPAGEYELVLINMAKRVVKLGVGGVYGIILFSDGLRRYIAFDETVPENRLSSWLILGFVVPAGMSITLAYVSLKAFTFFTAPNGLLGISFGFLTSIEYVTSWILYTGYKSWHPYPTAQALYTYGFALAFLLFVFMFITMKYGGSYSW